MRFMIIPMLCVTIFVILVVWFLLPRVARLMIHTPTAISIFVCLSMVQLMAVFISMRCTLCGHFLQVALTLILVVGYAIGTIMATIQRINIIGSREGSRNRRRLKANQTGKKFRVGIKSNISTNRNNLISGVDRCIHLNAMK